MPSRHSPLVLVLLAAVLAASGLLVTGCGSGGTRTVTVTKAAPRTSTSLTPADTADLQVVRRWADELRAGRVAASARTFALPARVANGGPPVTLRTRDAVAFFNETLPCGAKVVGATREAGGFLRVSFLLTERVGGGSGCGSGAGQVAQTSIRVRGGHITDWLRLPDPDPGPTTEA